MFFTALLSTIFNIKSPFKVTSKSHETGNYLKLVIPHFVYILVTIFVVGYAFNKHGLIPSVVTNASWAVFNIVFFFGYIRVAYPWSLAVSRSINFAKEKLSFGYYKAEQVVGAPAV